LAIASQDIISWKTRSPYSGAMSALICVAPGAFFGAGVAPPSSS
jgi:hypothetical protein